MIEIKIAKMKRKEFFQAKTNGIGEAVELIADFLCEYGVRIRKR
jgi:hypothetical protein